MNPTCFPVLRAYLSRPWALLSVAVLVGCGEALDADGDCVAPLSMFCTDDCPTEEELVCTNDGFVECGAYFVEVCRPTVSYREYYLTGAGALIAVRKVSDVTEYCDVNGIYQSDEIWYGKKIVCE